LEYGAWNGNAQNLSPGAAVKLQAGALPLWNDGFPGKILEDSQSLSEFEKELDVGPEYG